MELIPDYPIYSILQYPIQIIPIFLLYTILIIYLFHKAIMHKHYYLTPTFLLFLINKTL